MELTGPARFPAKATENPCVDSSILSLGTKLAERFWSKVDRLNGPVHPTLGRCHLWTGPIDADGYGVFGSSGKAHRIACEAAHGPAPFAPADASHACDLPRCCNSAHLSWKSHRDNVAEQFERGNHRNFRKHGKPYVCGACKGLGHNARTCVSAAGASQ